MVLGGRDQSTGWEELGVRTLLSLVIWNEEQGECWLAFCPSNNFHPFLTFMLQQSFSCNSSQKGVRWSLWASQELTKRADMKKWKHYIQNQQSEAFVGSQTVQQSPGTVQRVLPQPCRARIDGHSRSLPKNGIFIKPRSLQRHHQRIFLTQTVLFVGRGGAGDGLQLDEGVLALLFELVHESMFLRVPQTAESQIVGCSVAVEPAVADAVHHLLGVHAVLLLQYLHHCLLRNGVLVLEVDEKRFGRLVVEAKLAGQQFRQFGTVLGVNEDPGEELLGSRGENGFLLELACHYICLPFFVGIPLKGQLSAQHRVESHSQTPHIHQFGIVLDFADDFGRRIGGGSADGLAEVPVGWTGEAEVDQFHVPVLIEENVLWLDVTVADAGVPEVEECGEQLVEDAGGFAFGEGA